MLFETHMLDTAKMFKAFCDENRLIILEQLRHGTLCACELLQNLDISQPALSKQMKTLLASGVVTASKEGKKTFYTLNLNTLQEMDKYLQTYLSKPAFKKEA